MGIALDPKTAPAPSKGFTLNPPPPPPTISLTSKGLSTKKAPSAAGDSSSPPLPNNCATLPPALVAKSFKGLNLPLSCLSPSSSNAGLLVGSIGGNILVSLGVGVASAISLLSSKVGSKPSLLSPPISDGSGINPKLGFLNSPASAPSGKLKALKVSSLSDSLCNGVVAASIIDAASPPLPLKSTSGCALPSATSPSNLSIPISSPSSSANLSTSPKSGSKSGGGLNIGTSSAGRARLPTPAASSAASKSP